MTLLHFGVKYLKKKQKSINKKEDISIDKLSRFLKSCLASREDPTRACHAAGLTSGLNCTPKLHNIHHKKISNSKSKKETTFCLFYIRKTLVRAVTARFTTEYVWACAMIYRYMHKLDIGNRSERIWDFPKYVCFDFSKFCFFFQWIFLLKKQL